MIMNIFIMIKSDRIYFDRLPPFQVSSSNLTLIPTGLEPSHCSELFAASEDRL